MSTRQEFQERIKDNVYKGKVRPWYKRPSKLVLIFMGLGVSLIVASFIFLVIFYYQKISSGELVNQAVDTIEQSVRLELLHNGGDPSIGNVNAPVTIVAFEDFECPFCLEAQPFLKELLVKYGNDVRFIYKDFPLTTIHPGAQGAAEAAQCAHEQRKFWEFHDVLFANQDRFAEAYYRTVALDMGLSITDFNECMATGKTKKGIAEDLKLGADLGVVGTPTFFVNGELFAQGYSPALKSEFETAIEYIKGL